jgi:hypothetical protein
MLSFSVSYKVSMRADFEWPDYTGPDPHFDNILNLRDVGKTINQVTGKK